MSPVPVGNGTRRELAAILFMAGLEVAYNTTGSVCSSPQTTELRVSGEEGGGAAEGTLMKYVWLADVKIAVFTGLGSIIGRSPWPFIGGALGAIGMHSVYLYAKSSGARSARVQDWIGGRYG